jgi:DNA-directed RNA polymerase subunit RPC12/RpoP
MREEEMQINLQYGDTININGNEYVYEKGFSAGCNGCDLYTELCTVDECVIACGDGNLKRTTPKAIISCPYCGHTKYESIGNGLYVCTKCEKEFIIII